MPVPINTFKHHYVARYGCSIGKIALDVGVVCPNRALGGCVYCSAQSFKPYYLVTGDGIEEQLKKGKSFMAKRGFEKYFAYFQQETTTAVPAASLMPQLALPLDDKNCVGIIVSTRPDFLQDEFLAALNRKQKDCGKEILVELGLQSAHDKTLRFLNRNHTVADFVSAHSRLKKIGSFDVGAHLILGLPGESFEEMLQTVQLINRLGIHHVKFHHLQVIKDTPLHAMHREEPLKLYDWNEYLVLLAELIGYLSPHVVVHRLWSSSDPELLVGPRWEASLHVLQQRLNTIMTKKGIYQGRYVDN